MPPVHAQGIRANRHDRARSVLGGSCVIESAPIKERPFTSRFRWSATKSARRTGADWSTVMTRVLVIDDHPIVLQGCRQLLEDAGVNEIIRRRRLADGFRLYRTQKPDVIIVDLAMRPARWADCRLSAGFGCTISVRRSWCSPCIPIRSSLAVRSRSAPPATC